MEVLHGLIYLRLEFWKQKDKPSASLLNRTVSKEFRK